MLNIYKPNTYYFGGNQPVLLDNTVVLPSDEVEEDEEPAISEEELLRQKQLEAEEQERKFQEAVSAKVKEITEAMRGEIEQERSKIISTAAASAQAMAEDAKAATAAVLEKATKECAILKEKAKAEGFKEGFDEGKRQSLEKCSKYIDAAAQLLSDINSHKDAYYIENEAELRDTLFLMVEKITKEELKADPKVIERIIEDAARGFRNSDYLKISLADGEVSRELKSDERLIRKIIPYIKDIEIEILPDADKGTVILDNDDEILDASVPTQLDFLKEILRNTRGEEEDT